MDSSKRESERGDPPSIGVSGTLFLLVMLPVASACGAINGLLLGQVIAVCIARPREITLGRVFYVLTDLPPEAMLRLGGFGAAIGFLCWIFMRPRKLQHIVIALIAGFLAMLLPCGCCGFVFNE